MNYADEIDTSVIVEKREEYFCQHLTIPGNMWFNEMAAMEDRNPGFEWHWDNGIVWREKDEAKEIIPTFD